MFGNGYRFCVGDFIHLPGDKIFFEIHWRGQLLLGSPGRRYRVNVYWLGEPHWDCHYEDEISPVNQLPF
jgi:hypothetical protein